jgi:hypothetical protein
MADSSLLQLSTNSGFGNGGAYQTSTSKHWFKVDNGSVASTQNNKNNLNLILV